MIRASSVAAVLLGLVSIAHLLRLIFQVEIIANGAVVPMWLSVVGFAVSGAVSLWLWRERGVR